MNQINLDKLLQVSANSATSLNAGELKLAINQLYNARLHMLGQGQAQLNVLTPQGPLTITLNREQLAQLKLPITAANTAQQTTTLASHSVSNPTWANPTLANTAAALTTAHMTNAQTTPFTTATGSANLSNGNASVLALQLQFSELPGKALQLQLSQQGAAIHTPLTQAQAQQLLLSLLSLQLAKPSTEQQLPVRLNTQTAQLHLAIPGYPAQPLLQFSATRSQQLLQLLAPALTQTTARPAGASSQTTHSINLTLTGSADGKLLQLMAAAAQKVGESVASSPLSQANTLTKNQAPSLNTLATPVLAKAVTAVPIAAGAVLSRAEQQTLLQQLLPLLPSTTLAQFKNANSIQLGLLNLPLASSINRPHTTTTSVTQPAEKGLTVQLQLQPSQQERWSLQWRPLTQFGQLIVSAAAFNRPLQLQAATDAPGRVTSYSEPVSYKAEQAWRQLLPLLNERPASLAHSAQLPVAINQIFNLLRSTQADGNKVLNPAELVSQLQASVQFQPLQVQPNSQTSAGALAVAIQLLLGQLQRATPAPTGSTLAQRLTQQLAALDPAQSAQLLRQLAGHSSLLQQAQLVNVEQQGPLQQWLIPLALQQQGQSQFSQILLEERDSKASADDNSERAWQLTMKFDLGAFGPLLAKARLSGQQLSLQFYTEQAATLQLANKFLPLLTERCAAQGLLVTEAACQLGKIPDTLLPRRTSLVQVKV